jgi:hypothetical protein
MSELDPSMSEKSSVIVSDMSGNLPANGLRIPDRDPTICIHGCIQSASVDADWRVARS